MFAGRSCLRRPRRSAYRSDSRSTGDLRARLRGMTQDQLKPLRPADRPYPTPSPGTPTNPVPSPPTRCCDARSHLRESVPTATPLSSHPAARLLRSPDRARTDLSLRRRPKRRARALQVGQARRGCWHRHELSKRTIAAGRGSDAMLSADQSYSPGGAFDLSSHWRISRW